jgi:hypothetical protein
MQPFHLRGKYSFRKLNRLIKELKTVLFDVALLILFVAALVRLIRSEVGW